jgi:hypothetical protein
MIDVKEALLNPAAMFQKPQDIANSVELSKEQKIEILRRWEYDVRELQVADEEGMNAPKPQSVNLDSIRAALRALGAPADVKHSAPTKQGGS